MSLSCFSQMIISTRMHSSRMRTVRSSGRIWGGVCSGWDVSAPGGVWSQGGMCLVLGCGGCLVPGCVCLVPGGVCLGRCQVPGVSILGVCLVRGVSAPRGCLLPVGSAPGGCLLRGCLLRGVVSQHGLRQTPRPPCGQTDRRL